jgi:hypothetical protein
MSEREWAQVAAVAGGLGQNVSEFVREAALAASARVTGKVSERDCDGGLPVVAPEPVRHTSTGNGRAVTWRELAVSVGVQIHGPTSNVRPLTRSLTFSTSGPHRAARRFNLP